MFWGEGNLIVPLKKTLFLTELLCSQFSSVLGDSQNIFMCLSEEEKKENKSFR